MARSDSSNNSGSDSSKKVAKAAKAGATPNASVGRDKRPVGFQMAMLGIVVLGTALVAFSWNARDVQALSPSFNDHWHLPYGLYDCTIDGFQAPLVDPGTTHSGIHTHTDGVIHLHPFSSTATGNNATLDVFLSATTASFDGDDALTFTDRPALAEGVQCANGEDAILQVARFAPNTDTDPEVFTDDLEDVRLDQDFTRIVIALAPEGFDIPAPPADAIANAEASSPNVFDTFGVDGLENQLESAGIGFDEDGNLIDAEGEVLEDAEGNPINRSVLEQDIEVEESEDSDDE